MSTGSPPISRLRFLDASAGAVDAPREWTPALVQVDVPAAKLASAHLLRQGEPMPLYAKAIGGDVLVFADWSRSGTGHYRLVLEAEGWREELVVEVSPEKITPAAYGRLIDDLQTELPASVAIALQRGGALSGVDLRPPGETTIAQEMARLRRAVRGTSDRPGLAAVLVEAARRPHRVLKKTQQWVQRDRVRRLEPLAMIDAVRRAANVELSSGLPLAVPDVRVDHTVDTYENRLLLGFHDQVAARLRRIARVADANRLLMTVIEAEELQDALRRSRREASFLDEVSAPQHVPMRVTMVLLKRPEYRAMLESYLVFRRSAFVELDEPALDSPLENLPHLYEVWGTLRVIESVLSAAVAAGFEVKQQRLARLTDGGLYVKILPDGVPAVVLSRPRDGTVIKLIPQRTYTSSSPEIKSISFNQIPDVVIEVRRPSEPTQLFIFDPKYKLQSEDAEAQRVAKPKKLDIDAMHAYRDALRTLDGRCVVEYAAILYPGPHVRYDNGLEALPALPDEPDQLLEHLRAVLAGASS